MTWEDRIKEAAYTPPEGDRIVFQYENVIKTFSKKTSVHEFIGVEETFVQDFGVTSPRFPMRIFFWGDNYDIESDSFEQALSEVGIGQLEHPIYGKINVVPFGEIRRRDDLKTAANQSIIEVQFYETTNILYPISKDDISSNITTSKDNIKSVGAAAFAGSVIEDNTIDLVSLANKITANITFVNNQIKEVIKDFGEPARQFNNAFRSLEKSVIDLVNMPDLLADQIYAYIDIPSTIGGAVSNIYSDLVTISTRTIRTPTLDGLAVNEFLADDIIAQSCLIGELTAIIAAGNTASTADGIGRSTTATKNIDNNSFLSKPEILTAMETLIEDFTIWNIWRESNFKSLNVDDGTTFVDDGATYQAIQQLIAEATSFLIQLSFDFNQEKIITLDRSRNIIDLVAELYGEIDTKLNFFITTNNLTGSEILELPKGKEVVYYI